jgi:cob(I)alamin adenosyltransferase
MGLLHVYTGDGKGKTTAAIGLSLRAAANGLRVFIIQFMKALSPESGEIKAIKHFEGVTVQRHGANLLINEHPPVETIKAEIAEGISEAVMAVEDQTCDLLVLDEINVAVSMGLANLEDLLKLIARCKGRVELVMTGRNAPQEFIDAADYVTEFMLVKHPYGLGVEARRGIEF